MFAGYGKPQKIAEWHPKMAKWELWYSSLLDQFSHVQEDVGSCPKTIYFLKDLREWKDILFSWSGRLNNFEVPTLPIDI